MVGAKFVCMNVGAAIAKSVAAVKSVNTTAIVASVKSVVVGRDPDHLFLEKFFDPAPRARRTRERDPKNLRRPRPSALRKRGIRTRRLPRQFDSAVAGVWGAGTTRHSPGHCLCYQRLAKKS